MTSRRLDGSDALVPPMYLVAALLVATPALDFVTSVLPLRPGNIEWRFASVGLLSGFVLTPLLGVVLAMLTAAWGGHERFQRVLAIVNGVIAGVFALMLILFLLDIVQLRSAVQAEAKEAFEGAAVKAVLKHATFVVAAGWLSIRGFKASRWHVAPSKRAASAVIIGS